MEQKKYKLTNINRNSLRLMRKEQKLAAEDVSTRIGKSKAWLGQIERGKLQSIKKDDLSELLSIYYSNTTTTITKEDIISKGFLDEFLNSGLPSQEQDKLYSELCDINFAYLFYNCIEQAPTLREKEEIMEQIKFLSYCLETYPDAMNTIIFNSETLFYTLYFYSFVSNDTFCTKAKSFASKLSGFYNFECQNARKWFEKHEKHIYQDYKEQLKKRNEDI